jgi:hypothetical protein
VSRRNAPKSSAFRALVECLRAGAPVAEEGVRDRNAEGRTKAVVWS